MSKKKVGVIIVSSITAALGLAVAIPFSVLGIRSGIMDNDYSYLAKENKITPKRLEVPLTKQNISCGYAIIEMLSSYYGNPVSEASLYEKNNKSVTTSSTSGFVNEKQCRGRPRL